MAKMHHDTKFGERSSPEWSHQDWHRHKQLEITLLRAYSKARTLDPTFVMTVPSRDVMNLPSTSKARGTFMLTYAMDLYAAYLELERFYVDQGWIITANTIEDGRYVLSATLHGTHGFSQTCTYCRSWLCSMTWFVQVFAYHR